MHVLSAVFFALVGLAALALIVWEIYRHRASIVATFLMEHRL